MSDNNRVTSIVLFTVLTLIWGTSFILIKQGLKVFSPDEVGALRVTAASVFLLPLALIKLKEVKAGDYWKLFASGMMAVFIPAFLFATAQTHMASSNAGILNALSPIFTMIIGAFLFGQRFKGPAIVGIILGFAGAAVLSISQADGAIAGFNAYALLIVLACFFYGSNLNFVKFVVPNIPSITITSVSILLTGPFAAVYLFGFTGFTSKLSEQPGAWQAAGFVCLLALLSTAIAILIFNRLIKLTTPLFASSVTYVMPIVAVIWGLLDGEPIYAGHAIGMAAIIGGVYLANRKSV
jgi:drug/metabolite transporter (DMT)-like permease